MYRCIHFNANDCQETVKHFAIYLLTQQKLMPQVEKWTERELDGVYIDITFLLTVFVFVVLWSLCNEQSCKPKKKTKNQN